MLPSITTRENALGIDPERVQEHALADLALDLLVGALEHADAIGAGNDSDEHPVAHDRDPVDLVVNHQGRRLRDGRARRDRDRRRHHRLPNGSSRDPLVLLVDGVHDPVDQPPVLGGRPSSFQRMSTSEMTPMTCPSASQTGALRDPVPREPLGHLLELRLFPVATCRRSCLQREFSVDPKMLVAASPTRGLDVAAIETVHRHLIDAAARGVAVLLISEDLDETLALNDRIFVM